MIDPFVFPGQIWGCPWHGLVKGGLLYEADGVTPKPPTGTQKIMPQPTNGDCFLVKKPGIDPVSRTPEQLAEDAAAGHLWLNYALLSGREFKLYGNTLPGVYVGWIYFAADGSRWLINVTPTNMSTGAVTVVAKRFGEFGVAADTRTFNLVLGQVTDLSVWVRTVGTTDRLTNYQYQLCDTTLGGNKGVWTQSAQVLDTTNLPSWANDTIKRPIEVPLGFVEIVMSGGVADLAASGTVLKKLSQCFSANMRIVTYWYDASGVAQPVTMTRTAIQTSDEDYLGISCNSPDSIALNAQYDSTVTFTHGAATAAVPIKNINTFNANSFNVGGTCAGDPPSGECYTAVNRETEYRMVVGATNIQAYYEYVEGNEINAITVSCAGSETLYYSQIATNPIINTLTESHDGLVPLFGVLTRLGGGVSYGYILLYRVSNGLLAVIWQRPTGEQIMVAVISKSGRHASEEGSMGNRSALPYGTFQPVTEDIVFHWSSPICFV